MIKTSAVLLAATCALCVEWTRITGIVKRIDLKAQTVTLQTRDGDLFTVPVDYQLSITEKHGEVRSLKTLRLDEKVTVIRTPAEPPHDDSEGLVPPEPPPHGL